jgi:hypothetical protein
MTNEERLVRPDPEIQARARKHYREDPATKELIGSLYAAGPPIERLSLSEILTEVLSEKDDGAEGPWTSYRVVDTIKLI